MPLAALPSVASAILRPSVAVRVRLLAALDEAKTPGIWAALTAETREAASVIVPVTGTPFTVSALPARAPKLSTVRARVVLPTVACTPVLGVAALMATATARALAAASTVESGSSAVWVARIRMPLIVRSSTPRGVSVPDGVAVRTVLVAVACAAKGGWSLACPANR
jgi:hypothetical protein